MGTAALDLDRTFPLNIHNAVPRRPTGSTSALRDDGVENVAALTLVEHHGPKGIGSAQYRPSRPQRFDVGDGASPVQPRCDGVAPRVSHRVGMATERQKMPARAVAFWACGGLLAVAGFWFNALYTRTNVATGATSHPFAVVGWIMWLAGLGLIAAAIEFNRS